MNPGESAPAPPDTRPAPTRGRSWGAIVTGLVLVLLGVAWLLAILEVDFPWETILPGALILVGAALAVLARSGRYFGLVWIGVALTVVLGIISTLDVPLRGGIGDRDIRPATLGSLASEYRLGIGKMSIDLSDVVSELPGGVTRIEASVGIGDLSVGIPDGVPVRVEGHVGAGRLMALDEDRDGLDVDAVVETPDYGSGDGGILLELAVGAGKLEVRTS